MKMEYRFDPAHCAITFQIKHIFVNVSGRFSDFSGSVSFDPEDLDGSFFDVKVLAASLDTFVEMRNTHLRSPDFFDVATFPEISFKSSQIQHKSERDYVLKGLMTLKGISREVELPFTFFGTKINPMDPKQEVAGFSTKLDVFLPDYSFCDPKWSKMGIIGQTASLEVDFEMLRDL